MRHVLGFATVALLGCAPSPSDPGMGLHLQLRVRDAQLRRGELEAPTGGPAVTQVLTPQLGVVRGDATVQLGGRLGVGGVSLLVHAVGDPDHWQVAPDGFDFVVSDELLFGTELEFSHAIATGSLDIELQAVDEAGRVGPVTTRTFSLEDDVPAANLLVSLAWDNAVDLDLHVELPSGVVVGAKNTNAFEAVPGMITPPNGAELGAYHDFDSNQHCGLDLRNRENVVWEIPPASGQYRVFAQLFSACDEVVANLEVSAVLDAAEVATAGATVYAFDAREHPSDTEAPGLLVLEFEVP